MLIINTTVNATSSLSLAESQLAMLKISPSAFMCGRFRRHQKPDWVCTAITNPSRVYCPDDVYFCTSHCAMGSFCEVMVHRRVLLCFLASLSSSSPVFQCWAAKAFRHENSSLHQASDASLVSVSGFFPVFTSYVPIHFHVHVAKTHLCICERIRLLSLSSNNSVSLCDKI